ncbi:MAG: autotransporter domain-containing protein [Alphaproteobacteria bacterium]|nr:autotransporter domain-containing protein [Alphaproteobacteria bacterium]
MKSQIRNKARLLSRVSTIAVMAAAGAFGAAQQAQADCTTGNGTFDPGAGPSVTVTSPYTCVVINDPVTGNVTNQSLVGDPGAGFIPFEISADVGGQVINNGNIFGGYFTGKGTGTGALTIFGDATVTGGIVNNLAITSTTGNGIQIGLGGENGGNVLGGITNTDDISSGGRYGIAALYGSLSGGITNENNATISGGLAAIYVAETFGAWSGDITNSGQISGFEAAIVLGDGNGASSMDFQGGIVNNSSGVIDSLGGTAVVITNDVATFSGGISNSGTIEGADNGIVIAASSFQGGVFNNGGATISGLSGDAIQSSSNSWSGGLTNFGVISGSIDGLDFSGGGEGSSFSGNIVNGGQITGGGITGTAIRINADTFAGNVTNSGNMSAARGGISISANEISSGDGTATFTNTGTISGGYVGVSVFGNSVDMDFTNNSSDPLLFPPGVITGGSGAAVLLAANTLWEGDITNSGTLSGNYGMVVNGFSDGFIFSSGGDYTGTITNSGLMEGDIVGLYVLGDAITGDLNNTSGGQLIGTSTEGISVAGLVVSVNSWEGNITNSGLIQGAVTGAYIGANTFTGNIVNDGHISGGNGSITQLAFDPGLIVSVGSYTGDIINNGTLDAVTQALVVDVGTLTGSIINTGLIEATTPGNTAVLLEVGNGATFTNTSGGLVLGDIVFGGKAAYDFVGEDGGVEGQLLGEDDGFGGNDDTITVQNGTQYFFFEGKSTAPGIDNFASFTVEDGGTAVLGSRFVGDSNGSTEFHANVDNVVINDGGTLYIDQAATLAVANNYTQGPNGTVMFYLGAPGGSGFSSLTGVQTAGAGDYGQILVEGTATLDGNIAAFLDPAFGSANPGLEAVEYEDVIVADGGIVGDFSTLALINSNSIFELDQIIDGNTVDLRVQRTADVGHIGSLPGIVVEIAGPWKSMVNDRSNGIGSGSCGLAGASGGWCFNQFAQSGPGASQVMTDASPGEDPFAWLRTGVRRVGETAVWGRAVGVWGETDGDAGSSGTDFDVVGGIVGIDHVFSPILLAGVAGQWTTSDIDFNGLPDNAEVDSLELGAYMSYGDTRLYLNANASVIWHDIEVNRFGIGTQAFGDYDGTTISGYVEAGKIFETQSGFRIQPLVALSYAHLETDAYSETGTGTLLNVFESDFDTLKSNIGARFAYPFTMQSGRKLVPEARVVWAHEFLDDQSSFLATVQGGLPTPSLIVGEEYSRDTLILGTGLTAPLSDATTLFIDYDAGLNEDITTHTLSAGLRTRW